MNLEPDSKLTDNGQTTLNYSIEGTIISHDILMVIIWLQLKPISDDEIVDLLRGVRKAMTDPYLDNMYDTMT